MNTATIEPPTADESAYVPPLLATRDLKQTLPGPALLAAVVCTTYGLPEAVADRILADASPDKPTLYQARRTLFWKPRTSRRAGDRFAMRLATTTK